MDIESHPADPPFTHEQYQHLVKVLPDLATATDDVVQVQIPHMIWMVEPLDLIEIPNDAKGLPPPPGRFVPSLITCRFVRRFRPNGGTPFWYRLPQ